jgi:hypothetical protein
LLPIVHHPDEFRRFRRFVYRINSGEIAQLPARAFLYSPFGSRLRRCQRRIDKHFNKAPFANALTHHLALSAVREINAVNTTSPASAIRLATSPPGECSLCDRHRSKIAAQAVTHVIAIQQVGTHAQLMQRLFQRPATVDLPEPDSPVNHSTTPR